jgi:hypothetical protein
MKYNLFPKILSSIILAAGIAIGLANTSQAQISYTPVGSLYTQDFNIMGPTGTTTPTGWFVGSGPGSAVTGTTVTPDTGTNTTPDHYNYGVAGVNPVTDRALGSKNDSGQQLDTEVHFINNTGVALTQFTISYTGEEWRNGGSNNTNFLNLQFSLTGTAGSWISLGAAFNFASPINSLSATALDGNVAANRVTNIGGTFTSGTPVLNGGTFFFRFADPDENGKDDGLAIDDFSFRAVPEPSVYMLLGVGLLLCGQRYLRRKSA